MASGPGHDYRVLIQLSQRPIEETIDLIDKLQSQYGGSKFLNTQTSSYCNGRPKRIIHWSIGAKKAGQLIRDILPFLRIKKRQAELLLRLCQYRENHHFNNAHPKPAELWAEEEAVYIELLQLNRKNKKGGGNNEGSNSGCLRLTSMAASRPAEGP